MTGNQLQKQIPGFKSCFEMMFCCTGQPRPTQNLIGPQFYPHNYSLNIIYHLTGCDLYHFEQFCAKRGSINCQNVVESVKLKSYSSHSSSPWMYLRLLRKERELRACDERILMYPVTVLMSPRKFSNSEAMLARETEEKTAGVKQSLRC